MKKVIAITSAILLLAAACNKQAPVPPGDLTGPETSFSGKLIAGGVECQLFQSDDGKEYTLTGDLTGFKEGDSVNIKGSLQEISICQQGDTIAVSTITHADQTADWKTYTNTQYGFEFKYPANWYIDSDQYPINLSNYLNANTFNLGNTPADLESIFIASDEVGPMFKLDDLKQILSKDQKLVKFETITSASGSEGRFMVIYSSDHPSGNHTSTTFFKSRTPSGLTVKFSLGTNSEDQANLLNQIISTLKFTK